MTGSAFAAAVALTLTMGQAGVAQTTEAGVTSGPQLQLNTLETGRKLMVENQTGRVSFAGRSVDLQAFSGIVGYASDVAYVTVISGSASADGKTARPGSMLLLPPFGGEVLRERFDAGRLRDASTDDVSGAPPSLLASLETLARRQSRGIFFGLLGQTNFNVAASGVAADEVGRRTLLGGEAVREVRFSDISDPVDLQREIVTSFLNALKRGDAARAAQFIDPMPFGQNGLTDGAMAARTLMAQAIIDERNWSSTLGQNAPVPAEDAPDIWTVNGSEARTVVALRPTVDFTYVSTVSTER